jgi:lipopolysaccharide export system permease protein
MIWRRYLFREILKIFSLFLFSLYFLYIVMDYSTHMQEIVKSKEIPYSQLLLYYGMLFSENSNLLLPLALLIASVKVLCSFNRNYELLAFQAGGISLKKLSSPFFFIALLCMGANYLNFEYFIPHSITYMVQFEKKYFKKNRKEKKSFLHVFPMENGTRLIYQHYDAEKKNLFDVFWVLSSDEVWYMKTLDLRGPHPVGSHVDCLRRNAKRQMEKHESYRFRAFPMLSLDFSLKNTLGRTIEGRSISELLLLLKNPAFVFRENRASIKTYLYYKLCMPLLSLLVVLASIPFCVRFSRNLSVFILFSLIIFGYLAFFMLLEACTVLGEAKVLSPFWAIFTLPIVAALFFGRKFLKICYCYTQTTSKVGFWANWKAFAIRRS